MLEKLEALKGKFWTHKKEFIEELEELGFEVVADSEEQTVVMTDEDEDIEYNIWLIVAGSTIAVEAIYEAEIQ